MPDRYCKGGCGRIIPYAGFGRPRVWCAFCSKDETRKTDKRKAPRRAIADDFGTVRIYKRCTACRGWKELSLDNFTVRRRDRETGRIMEWQAECRPCINERRRREWAVRDAEGKRERGRRQYRAIMADERKRERERRRKRERDRRRRANMTPAQRERYNAQKRAAYARVMAKPGARERRAESRRMLARMRALDEGREMPVRPAMGGWRPSGGNTRDAYPVEPLALWLEAALAQDGREREEIAEAAGIDDRVFRRVQRREYVRVTLGVADALLWGYDKPIRIPEQVVEERLGELADLWRSAPGNGERLIGYLTDAERIAHLAGAVVDRVEDLWPALAE
jgi:hypothetical protein